MEDLGGVVRCGEMEVTNEKKTLQSRGQSQILTLCAEVDNFSVKTDIEESTGERNCEHKDCYTDGCECLG